MAISNLFKKEPKMKYVVFKDEYDELVKTGYHIKNVGFEQILYEDNNKYMPEQFAIYYKNVIKDEIETESEADNLIYVLNKIKSLTDIIKNLEEKFNQLNVDNYINKLFDSCNVTDNIKDDNKSIYVITGEYPRYSIDKKHIITKDDYNYCLKEKDIKNISLWPKDKCFDTYEKANNKVLELIQNETSKEHQCACKCNSKKK